jgi:hypothetical protein
MIACGITARYEELDEPLEVTINEASATVYVRTRDGRLFRASVAEIYPFKPADEEPPR